ncbi:MAG TPA: phosphopantothenoylcysteine decarboxylase [Candidatus Paceibacterota bacterium]|nr:phosphopantothenoylcysteine decarboxylase [Verrucomicrobiota bacterium]HRY49299.1 phosphopantothenoylcysteine decarboxylase [Candidatus Paceibacterota bacterium]HSA01850.1 phosphopantothenoylcysteine decarboxylase [Candidatus Paceibacterota bacterium]
MKCLITAGPTFEPLDQVRRLTNFSTGTLGSKLANHLVARGHQVLLLLGQASSCRVELQAQELEHFTTTDDLRQRLCRRQNQGVEAVFHAAAVSDFAFGRISRRTPDGNLQDVAAGKISTSEGPLLAELLPTPKLIEYFRDWFPDACLVGWKYEVDGAHDTVIMQARRQIARCRTNACVANGPAYGPGFCLVGSDGSARPLPDAKTLFEALEHSVYAWIASR